MENYAQTSCSKNDVINSDLAAEIQSQETYNRLIESKILMKMVNREEWNLKKNL